MNRKPEDQFEYELEIFRKEADEVVQHLYAYLTMHAAAGDRADVRRLYNSNPLFWLTTLRALQTSVFIRVGQHEVDLTLRHRW